MDARDFRQKHHSTHAHNHTVWPFCLLPWLNYKEKEHGVKKKKSFLFPCNKRAFPFYDALDNSRLQPEWKPPSLSRDCVISSSLFPEEYLLYWQTVWIWVDNDLDSLTAAKFSVTSVNTGKLKQYTMTRIAWCSFLTSWHIFIFQQAAAAAAAHLNVFPWAVKCCFSPLLEFTFALMRPFSDCKITSKKKIRKTQGKTT